MKSAWKKQFKAYADQDHTANVGEDWVPQGPQGVDYILL